MILQRQHLFSDLFSERSNPALVDLSDRYRIEMIVSIAPLMSRHHQTRLLQHAEVLHHCVAAELGELLSQVPGGARPIGQLVEQLGFFCYKSKSGSDGYLAKQSWLTDRFAEGMQIKILFDGKRSPSAYGVFAVIHDGEFVSYHPIGTKDLLKRLA